MVEVLIKYVQIIFFVPNFLSIKNIFLQDSSAYKFNTII